jgi:hypothetical protein
MDAPLITELWSMLASAYRASGYGDRRDPEMAVALAQIVQAHALLRIAGAIESAHLGGTDIVYPALPYQPDEPEALNGAM